jgi:hypothetical protein
MLFLPICLCGEAIRKELIHRSQVEDCLFSWDVFGSTAGNVEVPGVFQGQRSTALEATKYNHNNNHSIAIQTKND